MGIFQMDVCGTLEAPREGWEGWGWQAGPPEDENDALRVWRRMVAAMGKTGAWEFPQPSVVQDKHSKQPKRNLPLLRQSASLSFDLPHLLSSASHQYLSGPAALYILDPEGSIIFSIIFTDLSDFVCGAMTSIFHFTGHCWQNYID